MGRTYIKMSDNLIAGHFEGCFHYGDYTRGVTPSGTSKDRNIWQEFNAHNVYDTSGNLVSTTLYGNSSTVTPESVAVSFIIKY